MRNIVYDHFDKKFKNLIYLYKSVRLEINDQVTYVHFWIFQNFYNKLKVTL